LIPTTPILWNKICWPRKEWPFLRRSLDPKKCCLLFSGLLHKNEYIPGVLSFKIKFSSKIGPPYCGSLVFVSESLRWCSKFEFIKKVKPFKIRSIEVEQHRVERSYHKCYSTLYSLQCSSTLCGSSSLIRTSIKGQSHKKFMRLSL
jgi:hypothetical protein